MTRNFNASQTSRLRESPIGYLNARGRDELSSEACTVQLDLDRVPLIEWAYKTYVSGN